MDIAQIPSLNQFTGYKGYTFKVHEHSPDCAIYLAIRLCLICLLNACSTVSVLVLDGQGQVVTDSHSHASLITFGVQSLMCMF